MNSVNKAAKKRRGPTTVEVIKPGSLVWLERTAVKPGEAKKLKSRWLGPYRVIAVPEDRPNVIRIEVEDGIVRTYNREKCTPYRSRRFTYPNIK